MTPRHFELALTFRMLIKKIIGINVKQSIRLCVQYDFSYIKK